MSATEIIQVTIGGHFHTVYEQVLGVTLQRGDKVYRGTRDQFRVVLVNLQARRELAERATARNLTREINKLSQALGL